MARVCNPALSLLAAAFLLLAGGLHSAGADDTGSGNGTPRTGNCIVTPNLAVAKGRHWYYRTNRQIGRKCWYLRPAAAHHAAARPRSKPKAARRSTPSTAGSEPASSQFAAPPPPIDPGAAAPVAAAPPPPTGTAPIAPEQAAPPPPADPRPAAPEPAAPPPHAGEVAPMPGVSAAAAAAATWPGTQAAPGAAAAQSPAIQPPSHIEILDTVPARAPLPQAAQPGVPAQDGGTSGSAAATDGAIPASTGSEAAAGSDAAQQKPPRPADTIAARHPVGTFFVLAIGLSVLLVAIAIRIGARRREPIISGSLDSAWSNDQFDSAGAYAVEATDEQWPEEEEDVWFVDPRALDDAHEQVRLERPALSNNPTPAFTALPDADSLEPVLRLLRQA